MKPERNSVNTVLVASKHFLRTREGFHATPSVRGLARHIEANMRLYEAFAPDGIGSVLTRVEFAVWRLMLVAASETVILFNRTIRIWRWD